MKYLSIDIETTGNNPETDQILEFGAILEDTNRQLNYHEAPKFQCYIKHKRINGNVFALNMNKDIIEILKENNVDKHNILTISHFYYEFEKWLRNIGFKRENDGKFHLTVAGKNFERFDKKFLEKLPYWNNHFFIGRRAVIDPAEFYIDFKNDTEKPGTKECFDRAGIEKEVSHTALSDAWDMIRLLRKKY